jgi:hypothetical protein
MRVFITAGRGHRDYKSHLRVPDGVKMLRPCHQKTLANQTPPATQNMLAAPERNILEGSAKGGSPVGNPAPGIAAEIPQAPQGLRNCSGKPGFWRGSAKKVPKFRIGVKL